MAYDIAQWDAYWKRDKTRFNRRHKAVWDVFVKYVRESDTILDIGIGPGIFYEQAPKFRLLVGTDQSVSGLEKCRSSLDGIFLVSDAEHQPFVDRQFDIVFMMGVVNYYSDWQGLLTEATRVVRVNGYIGITLVKEWGGISHSIESTRERCSQFGKIIEIAESGVWIVVVLQCVP